MVGSRVGNSTYLEGIMRESQYADEYIDSGYTVATFLHHRLQGKAASYSGGYVRALKRAMNRRVAEGKARVGRSKHGGIAYYSVSQD